MEGESVQKITPFLWFESQAEEAMNYYVSAFNDARVVSVRRYPDEGLEGPMQGFEGKVLTGVFELEGQRFMALDGGPHFKFNPAVSFFVNRRTEAEVEEQFHKLAEGGSVLMPLQEYPFSKRYGWLRDRYGVSWQVIVGDGPQIIVPSWMFVGDYFGMAEGAVGFYTSVFMNSAIDVLARYEEGEGDEVGRIKYASFKLEGQLFSAMESGHPHQFAPNGAVSMYVDCETQEEVDYYWERLAEGGDENARQCGWLRDKYGFSWQIIPSALPRLMSDPDKGKAGRVMRAMLGMKKIDIRGLERAYDGE